MYTSLVLIALTGSAAASAATTAPAWESDYAKACRQGQREHKPLAVVIGQGPKGWQSVTRAGRLNEEARRLLRSRYVCVYVDTERASGRRLAASFEMRRGPGLILSDYSGEEQAYRHKGPLYDRALERNLRKYADPDRVVTRTEAQGEPVNRSFYVAPAQPVVQPVVQPIAQPIFVPPPVPFGGFGGGFGGGGGRC